MIQELQLRILPEEAVSEQSLKQVVARETGISVPYIHTVRVLKRSIDARQRTIYVNVKLRAFINEQPDEPEFQLVEYKDVSAGKPVVVVGAGPGGLFAALRLIELGLRPIVIERGKNVRERKKDIALISREHKVDGESNYSFGEGGAGAYSDGKLYTRSKKRGSVDKILNVFCQFGASTSILADAHPHIGTDKLPRVIENIREQIIRCGGEVHFETRMDALVIRNGEVVGVETNTGENFLGPVILATGHSARDVYRYLHDRQIPIEAKGIAVGVRLEHPQMLIDQIQYHRKEGRGNYLPAAEYSFVAQVGGRGVYSFCMCPGGFVVPAASSSRQVVVNGMSPSNRGSRWANSGMVVEIRPEDYSELMKHEEMAVSKDSPLALMAFQERLEELCWLNGGMKQTAPAQRMVDFVNKKNSFDLPESSYTPGLLASPLHFWMPEFVTGRLREGFRHFGKVSRGFLTNDAVMIGVETRTSSPVRILRDKESYQHITLKGLFPCGEGAGYAGGIADAVIMRFCDVMLSFPAILLALLIDGIIRVILPENVHDQAAYGVLIFAISLSGWVRYARTVRGATLSEKKRDYVQAAKLFGVSPTRIMFTHILPNVLGPVLVLATVQVALAIITEATLSFLGVGVPPTTPSLGTLIRIGNEFLFSGEWWITIFPGVALILFVLSVNMLGDWLRDALNPKLQ